MNSPQATRKTQLKNDTFGPVSRLLKRDFVIIEVGIMGISKGNLEPVKGSRLPVKVRKDINQEEICQFVIKNIATMTTFSQTWRNMCCYIQIKNSISSAWYNWEVDFDEMQDRIKKPFSKLALFLCKEKDFQSSLLTGFDDELHILIFSIFFKQK